MRWGRIVLGLLLAVTWHAARPAAAQFPSVSPTQEPPPPAVRPPDSAWPVQPAAYQSPVAVPAPSAATANQPAVAAASPSAPAALVPRPLKPRKGETHAAQPGAAETAGSPHPVLGRAPLASRQQVHLVRCGRKLLLLSVSPGGIETLSEIDDPLEVDRLAGLCVQAQPGSASMVFRQVFQQFSAPQGRVTRDAEPPAEIRHA
jgi:hypothetical protein